MDQPPAKRVKIEGEANVFESPETYGEFANSVESLMALAPYTQRPQSQPPPRQAYPPNYAQYGSYNQTPSYESRPSNNSSSSQSAAALAADPNKLNDALAAAGVNIAEEEEISLNLHLRAFATQSQTYRQQPLLKQRLSPFLNLYQLAQFMTKVAKENGVHQNFHSDHEMLELMLAACENWMMQIMLKTLLLSHHRRRGIALFQQPQDNPQKQPKRQGLQQRLELSRELRNMAAKQKELEEKRIQKRVALGLEKDANSPAASDAKGAAAEEALYRLTNETVAMMTTGKKKYAWMDAGGGNDKKASLLTLAEKNKQSALITARGDNGLRYREIRLGNLVMMKDLLSALELERMGTQKAMLKGYAKLKE